MVLAINVGNTHITFGLIESGEILDPVMNIKTDMKQTSFGYASEMKQVLELSNFDIKKIDGAIISSVVPPLTNIMKKCVKLLSNVEALVVGVGVKSGIHIHTDDPGTVASDLVATAVGAREAYPLPCVIVDMGTAVTLTVVDEEGRFTGGAFMPGINLSLGALAEETALLPRIDVAKPKKAIASSTVECIRSGVVYGYAGAIDGIIDRFASELGREPQTVVSTGGMADIICSYSKRNVIKDENLLLKGLGIIYNKNKK